MLIEFSVTNFRSIRERQTLSMVAAPRLAKKENTFAPKLEGERFPDLLKAAAIYGPNASGKSNLLRALSTIQLIALRSPSPTPRRLPVAPFRFDADLMQKPSVIELEFISFGMRYSFKLEATPEQIVLERLSCHPKGKEELLYERNWLGYQMGPKLIKEVGGDVFDTWVKLTPPDMLFITQAVANSSKDVDVLRRPFMWLSRGATNLLGGMRYMAETAKSLIADNGAMHQAELAEFLQEFDVPVTSVKVTQRERAGDDARASYRTVLTHATALGSADILFEDESEGTKNLFGFWLPWVTRDSRLADGGCILVVDEIDSSLHPKIVEALVARHLHAPKTSQMIFTTHDTHLMDSKLLRRDQIWITERDAFGATQLRSVYEFKGRESDDIEKRYYEGRYRGLPLTSSE